MCAYIYCFLQVIKTEYGLERANFKGEQEVYKNWKTQITLVDNYIDQTPYSKIILYNKQK